MPGKIIVNPDVLQDKRDAMAVAWNEGLRLLMEDTKFMPAFEPTAEQRKFFSNTAYAEDDTALKRTIVARVATHDTSVSPTPEQEKETVRLLDLAMEMLGPQHQDTGTLQKMRDSVSAGKARGPVSPGVEGMGAASAEAADLGGKVKEFQNPLLREMVDMTKPGPAVSEPPVVALPAAKAVTDQKLSVKPRALNYMQGADPKMEKAIDEVIAAVEVAEGNAADNAVGDQGRAVGKYQMWPIMVKEANDIVGRKDLWKLEDRNDPVLSRAMAKTILSYYYRGGTTDPVELGARWRNPYSKAPEWYKNKVRKGLGEPVKK